MTQAQIIMMVIWIVIAIVSVIVEIATEGLVSIWFAIGAIISLPFVFIPGCEWYYQLLIFMVISAVCIVLFKFLWRKKLAGATYLTNVDSLVGTEQVLLEDVSPEKIGTLKIRDIIWSVKSSETINKGDSVIIKEVIGNSLFVIKKKEEK